MGASDFLVTETGKNAHEAFQNAVADAEFRFGNDPYSGTIKEKDSFIEIPLPKGKYPHDYAYKMINEDPRFGDKRGPAGCLLIKEEDIFEDAPYATETIRNKRSGTRKWKTQYTVLKNEFINIDIGFKDIPLKSFDTQTAAETFAKQYTIKHNGTTKIIIEKILVGESSDIVTFRPKTKKEKVPGGKKTYMFFGMAAE